MGMLFIVVVTKAVGHEVDNVVDFLLQSLATLANKKVEGVKKLRGKMQPLVGWSSKLIVKVKTLKYLAVCRSVIYLQITYFIPASWAL